MSLLDYLRSSAVRNPVIGSAQFRDMLNVLGMTVTIRKRSRIQDADCTCVDSVYRRPDMNCSICGGSGKVEGWVKRLARAIIAERDPHLNFGAGRILSTGGEYERADAYAYLMPGTDINDEDLLIFRSIEWLVKNKVIRYGTYELPIYVRCEIWKTPQKEVIVSARV